MKVWKTLVLTGWAVILIGCKSNESDNIDINEILNQPLVSHPDLVSGVLPNGLRYYVLNTKSGNTTLHLNIDVGSYDETDNERGYAHLIEHMAFQGTQSHSFEALQSLYRESGMSLGPDINAFTSYYTTQYIVDLNNKEIEDAQFYQFSDWLADISKGRFTFPLDQLKTEKTVINAERLLRSHESYAPKSTDALINGTGLEHKSPIGEENITTSATRQALSAFTKVHYQPNNSVLVVVGDINERRLDYIKQVFGGNETPVETSTHQPYKPNLKTFFYQKEQATSFSNALLIGAEQEIKTQGDVLQTYLERSFRDVLYERLKQSDDANQDTAFSIDVSPGQISNRPVTSITLGHNNQSHPIAIQTLTQELTRLSAYGLTESEYASFNKKWASFKLADESQLPSSAIVNRILNRIENNGVFSNPTDDDSLAQNVLRRIDKERLDQYLKIWASQPVRWSFSGTKLDNDKLKQQIALASRLTVPPPTELSLPIIPVPQLPPAKVLKESKQDGIVHWQLSNGVDVILEPRSNSDRISFLMFTNVGLNRLQTIEEYDAAMLAPAIFAQSGQNWIQPAQMESLLRSHNMSLKPVIGAAFNGIELQSEAKDATLALSILYNAMQNAVVNPTVFEQVKKTTVENMQTLTPNEKFHIQLQENRIGFEAVRANTTAERFNKVTLESIERLYRQLYQQVDGYTLVVVGKFTPDRVRSDILSFVGSLPKGKLYSKRTAPQYQIPKTKRITLTDGEAGKSHIHLGYSSPRIGVASIKERVAFLIIASTLNQRLFDTLREKNGWVYNVQVQQQYNDGTFSWNLLDATMTLDPQYEAQAIKEVKYQFQLMKEKGISVQELQQFKTMFKDSFASTLSDDLSTAYTYGSNAAVGINYYDALNYEETFNEVTLDYVNALIPNFLPDTGISIGILTE